MADGIVHATRLDGDAAVDVAIVGAGAAGLTAALAARDTGASVAVLERDAVPAGSTGLSSGFVPACGTRWQRAADVADSADLMSADILAKAKQQTDATIAKRVCSESGPALEWLCDRHGIEFVLLDGFSYPGHSVLRMHAVPQRTGQALVDALAASAARAGADILTNAAVTQLYARDDGHVLGIELARPDGSIERIDCRTLVLACNGFGGNPDMVAQHIPEMRDALYFGHPGNRGDAMRWGAALGAELVHLSAYQGHGSVATPHGVLITWALMMEGGIQVNAAGERFSNEHGGYSEQSVNVLAQPGGIAFNLYDQRLHELGQSFADYRAAESAGAVRTAEDIAALAQLIDVAPRTLERTLRHCADCARGTRTDTFGRDFRTTPMLTPPYYATRVTGALFHTQGGLAIDTRAAVLRADGSALPNLFAAGGAARGVSGPAVWGYLSGNGLLTAIALGRIAGASAAMPAIIPGPKT